jgi:hypothetical protein
MLNLSLGAPREAKEGRMGIVVHKGSPSPAPMKEAWKLLVAVPEAEGKAFVSNKLAHEASEFLKAHGLKWNGMSKKKIPGL